MYSQIRDKYATIEFPFKFPDLVLPDWCFGIYKPEQPEVFHTNTSSFHPSFPRPSNSSGLRINSGNPSIDYQHHIDDFLGNVALEPTKYEFKKLKELDQRKHVINTKADVARRQENLLLNRFINIYPYDYNRIKLQFSPSGTDYINGSYITGPLSSKTIAENSNLRNSVEEELCHDWSKYNNINFIATQGPLLETLDHHWQTIYENDVDIIVLLTSLIEGGKEKCQQYWPSNSGDTEGYGCYDVMLMSEEKPRSEILKRKLYLLDTRDNDIKRKTGKSKEITHLHYVGWPDYGVPEQNDHIVNLVKDVRSIIKEDYDRNKRCNVLVHCSAGVGRTGTFIALYQMMEKIETMIENRSVMAQDNDAVAENQTLNIFTTVLQLRSKRVEMVQSWVQYKYLYASVSEYARQISNNSQPDDEVEYVNSRHISTYYDCNSGSDYVNIDTT